MDIETTSTSPPYLPYSTFKTGVSVLASEELPRRVDASLFRSMSGGSQGLFISALRQFGLIDASDTPTETLAKLVKANEAEWKTIMRTLVEARYKDQLPILATGTPAELIESFKDLGAVVREKAIRFLLAAAKETGIKVKEAIANGRYGSGTSTASKRTSNKSTPNSETPATPAAPVVPQGMWEFPIPFRGKAGGKLLVPDNIDSGDLPTLQAIVEVVKAHAKAGDKKGVE